MNARNNMSSESSKEDDSSYRDDSEATEDVRLFNYESKESWNEAVRAQQSNEECRNGTTTGFTENESITRQQKGNNETDDEMNELNKEFFTDELQMALRKLKNNKVVGHDGIAAEFYKMLPRQGKEMLLVAINNIWMSGNMPEKWNVATIVPILKNGDESKVENYRGI
ncbi:uncharacterized protein [Chelonus insularis]|uniref:uncharacterized protein n=1 Tax=Chelonus insularis TaxID=460826 RepID=UPI00158A1AB4|nr:uncharacterized protein LOC118071428 [Chelonus insularis]